MGVSSTSSKRASEPGTRAARRAPARSRVATRDRILASATALFAERGIHDVTTHTIAEGAGVAAGTFYLHFKDKHAVFREIAFRAVAELKARVERVPDPPDDPAAGVAGRARELLAFAEENRELVSVLFGRRGAAAGLAADVLEHLVAWCADDLACRRQLAGAQRSLAADVDPAIAAQGIVGMWARVLTWWAEEPGRASRDAVVRTLVALQLSGLAGAYPPSPEDPHGG